MLDKVLLLLLTVGVVAFFFNYYALLVVVDVVVAEMKLSTQNCNNTKSVMRCSVVIVVV